MMNEEVRYSGIKGSRHPQGGVEGGDSGAVLDFRTAYDLQCLSRVPLQALLGAWTSDRQDSGQTSESVVLTAQHGRNS